jgi:hypothetical protein
MRFYIKEDCPNTQGYDKANQIEHHLEISLNNEGT